MRTLVPNIFCFVEIPLEKGYYDNLGIMNPPKDDDWWERKFTHINFDSLFDQIANIVPETMAKESFKKTKWIIDSKDRNEPVKWHESDLIFFSDDFKIFLQQRGKI